MTARILGVHEDRPPADTAADYPGHTWGGAFVSNRGRPLPKNTSAKRLKSLVLNGAAPYTDAGGGCLVRVKIDMAAAARGDWDERLTELGAVCVGERIVLVIYHEPEDNMKASTFVPGFNRARQAIKAGGPSVDVAYAGMAYQWRPGASKTADDPKAWAENLQADFYLLDVYFGQTFGQSLTLANHPGRVRWHAHMLAPYPERRAGLAEWGRMADPGRAAGFRADFDWLANTADGRRYEVVCPWGTDGTEKNAGWLLDDEARAAIREGFALLAQPNQPAGFRPASVPDVLVCEQYGCLVAQDLASRHTHP
ncbi:MAG TPA: hypothetical protein VFX60_19280 [Micromonospora sp.]|nr:hypothetical protein [Micromonospora sp.]